MNRLVSQKMLFTCCRVDHRTSWSADLEHIRPRLSRPTFLCLRRAFAGLDRLLLSWLTPLCSIPVHTSPGGSGTERAVPRGMVSFFPCGKDALDRWAGRVCRYRWGACRT